MGLQMKKNIITQEQIMNILDVCYGKAVGGVPKTKNCYELADEYLEKYVTAEKASKEFIKWQVAKCTTSGFITSLGGILTLPVSIPANLASVWYIQLRMIATIATISGSDPLDDDVQTLAYLCLTGSSLSKICRDAGVQFSNKLTLSMVKKIPGATLTKINQKVGFRFLTKFGEKGIINLGKMVPVAGGVIGGSMDLIGTKIIAKKAYNVFLLDKFE